MGLLAAYTTQESWSMAGMEVHAACSAMVEPEKRQASPPTNCQCPKIVGIAHHQEPCGACSVPGDFKTVEMVDPDDTSRTIRVKMIRMMSLANTPPKRFQEIDKTLLNARGDLFEHLPPATMCPLWLFDEMAGAETLICGSQIVIMKLYDVALKENDRRLKVDPDAPRVLHLLRVPMSKRPTTPKAAGDPTVFDVRWLLILASDNWDKKVLFQHPTFMREASRIDRFLLL